MFMVTDMNCFATELISSVAACWPLSRALAPLSHPHASPIPPHTHPLAEVRVVLQPNHHLALLPRQPLVVRCKRQLAHTPINRGQPTGHRPSSLHINVGVDAAPGVQDGVPPEVGLHDGQWEGAVHAQRLSIKRLSHKLLRLRPHSNVCAYPISMPQWQGMFLGTAQKQHQHLSAHSPEPQTPAGNAETN